MSPGNFPPGPADVGHSAVEGYLFYRNFLKDPLGRVTRQFNQYGDVWHHKLGDTHLYDTANPDMIREVLVRQSAKFIKGSAYTSKTHGMARFTGDGLVTSNGEFWKRQRRLVAPAFHTQRVTAYADAMVDITLEHLRTWRAGDVLDIADEMTHLTLMIVGRTLFDADASTTVDEMKHVVEIIQKANNTATLLPHWVPTPLRIRSQRAQATLDKIIYGFINQRRATGEDHGDLLSMLLLSEDEDGERMTDLQVRDEAVTLFLAGHETTANALNWSFWLLSKNPDAEARLHAELDAVLAGRPPSLDDLPNLPYTDAVIKESMRLMPPVWSISREAIEDIEIIGYTVPKGSRVLIIIYCLHRHPGLWERPLDFLPERWLDGSLDKLPKYAYIPFGGGPRICIGNSFATMEANLLLSAIAQSYRPRLIDGFEVVPQPMITMYPRDGLPMRLEARERQPSPIPLMQREELIESAP